MKIQQLWKHLNVALKKFFGTWNFEDDQEKQLCFLVTNETHLKITGYHVSRGSGEQSV